MLMPSTVEMSSQTPQPNIVRPIHPLVFRELLEVRRRVRRAPHEQRRHREDPPENTDDCRYKDHGNVSLSKATARRRAQRETRAGLGG
jgi:hypothetical protein